jgi:hypothetical protein
MRYLLLLLLYLGTADRPQKQPATNKQSPQEQKQKTAINQPVSDTQQQGAEPVAKPTLPVQNQAAINAYQQQDRAQSIKEINDTLLVIFTGLLVGVGFLQWRVLRKHEEWMQKHDANLVKLVNAAVTSANATDAGTIALKNIYRAWVLIVWRQGSVAEQFDLSLKNWGQTPARIEYMTLRETVVTGEDFSKLQSPDTFTSAPQTIAPSETTPVRLVNARSVANLDWDVVFHGKKSCVWYGVIAYRDVLDPSLLHETGFCFWYNGRHVGLNIGGPPEYNKAT